MLDRIRICLCHPRRIGIYFKDKVWTVILMILLFFGIFGVASGIRTYTSEYFSDASISKIVSNIVQGEISNIKYDQASGQLSGRGVTYSGSGYVICFLDEDNEKAKSFLTDVAILFNQESVVILSSGEYISEVKYSDINAGSFTLNGVQANNTADMYNFKVILRGALDSSNMFFLTALFLSDLLSNLFSYLFSVLLLYFFSRFMNPTIEKRVRWKLCFYDGLIYFLVALLGVLFNASWLSYVAILLPVIYGNITFRHIIRVPVKK